MYGKKVTKSDIFYYIYALLQSRDYIELYGDNIIKEMPRIPMLDGFAEYVKIGKQLAGLHINYEQQIKPEDIGVIVTVKKEDYTVDKMKFKKSGKIVCDDTIIYNDYILISNIPHNAYDYVVNGKSAIEWVMERYAVTVDKASGIVDNPNSYAGGEYIFNLLLSVIDISIKTQELINCLPEYKEI